jgi:hypothetical protein
MRRVAVVGALAVTMLAALATPAVAAPLDGGCSGTAQSRDDGGGPVDNLAAPDGATGTKSNPFEVEYDGTVAYQGTGPVITDHSWKLAVFGVPVKTGGDDNEGKDTTADGTETVKEYLPFRVAGIFYVSGDIEGTGGECTGSGWVRLKGNPAGTIPWLVGLVVLASGAVLLVFATPTGPFVTPLDPAGGAKDG